MAAKADRSLLIGTLLQVRYAVFVAALLTVTLTACDLPRFGGGQDASASGDSIASPSVADSTLVAAADSAVATDSATLADDSATAAATSADSVATVVTSVPVQVVPAAPGATVALQDQMARILEGQQAINRRLDSLATARARPAVESATGSQVLDQAGQNIRSFGVGVVWSVIVILIFNYTIRGSVWLLDALSERNPARRLFYKRLVPIIRIVLWVFAAYLIVRVIFQITAEGLFAAAAAVGVAVGFAAQDLLKNLFGGLILVFDQPFQVGDKVSVGGTYGEVVSIGLRSTRIVTPDDNLVSVPNAQVVDQQVANANAGELNCQVVTDLFLPGWADEDLAKRIAFNAAASSKYVYLSKPIVTLVADQFKETFLTRVRVKAYVLDPRLEFLFQSDVTERARAGFRAAGLLNPRNMVPHLVIHPANGDLTEIGSDAPVTETSDG